MSAEPSVDEVSGGTLDASHDLRERMQGLLALIDEWDQNQMNVVRHDHGRVQRVHDLMIVETGLKHYVASPGGQPPAAIRNERDEVGFVVALEMGQIATIKGHLSRGLLHAALRAAPQPGAAGATWPSFESPRNLTSSNYVRLSKQSRKDRRRVVMGAEYNKISDNTALRIALIVLGFALWATATVGFLALAA